ncbi:MAG: ADP-ribosylglycohydrolase family protein [Bacteroidota bacterium]
MNKQILQDKARGALLGLAIGDALGTTLEFTTPGSFEPLTDMVGGGPFRLVAGQWTDDTSMALCLAHSLVEMGGFSARDQIGRYLNWYQHGYMSVTGECFDIGSTVLNALEQFELTDEPYAGNPDPYSAGNGSIMRLAPIPIFYHQDWQGMMLAAIDSSRTTHGAETCLDSCRYMAGLMYGALHGAEKSALLQPFYSPIPGYWAAHPLQADVHQIAAGSFLQKVPPEIRGSGYVIHSLEAALWAFARSEDFETGALMAVNLGEDADTTGAVYAQIAGAYYGYEGIPAHWRGRVYWREEMLGLVDQLLQSAPPGA